MEYVNLGNSGLRVSISGRRSYIGEVLEAVIPAGSVGLLAAPVYYDAQVRLDWRVPNTNHALQFIALTYFAVPAVFMGLHVFVSFLQAYIFMLLAMMYVGGAVSHEH